MKAAGAWQQRPLYEEKSILRPQVLPHKGEQAQLKYRLCSVFDVRRPCCAMLCVVLCIHGLRCSRLQPKLPTCIGTIDDSRNHIPKICQKLPTVPPSPTVPAFVLIVPLYICSGLSFLW